MQVAKTNHIATSFGALSLTPSALNDIALDKAGIIGHLGENEVMQDLGKVEVNGFGFKWIGATEGVPGRGYLILVGLTPSAKRYLFSGKINLVCRVAGVTTEEATTYLNHTHGVRYSMDQEVIALWGMNRDNLGWAFFDGARNKKAWVEEWGINLGGYQAEPPTVESKLKYLYTACEVAKAIALAKTQPVADKKADKKAEATPAKVLASTDLSKLNFGHLAAKTQKGRDRRSALTA